jgi:DNA-binding transcriptional regulator YdaS (Cro superfamily)
MIHPVSFHAIQHYVSIFDLLRYASYPIIERHQDDHKMDLQSYIRSFPRRQRMAIRRRIGQAHGVSEVTVRSWANGARKHPCSLHAITITERITNNSVTRFDLRPDIFGRKEP